MERARGGPTPPLAELIVGRSVLGRPSGKLTEEGRAHLRVWMTATVPQVTVTSPPADASGSAGPSS